LKNVHKRRRRSCESNAGQQLRERERDKARKEIASWKSKRIRPTKRTRREEKSGTGVSFCAAV